MKKRQLNKWLHFRLRHHFTMWAANQCFIYKDMAAFKHLTIRVHKMDKYNNYCMNRTTYYDI